MSRVISPTLLAAHPDSALAARIASPCLKSAFLIAPFPAAIRAPVLAPPRVRHFGVRHFVLLVIAGFRYCAVVTLAGC